MNKREKKIRIKEEKQLRKFRGYAAKRNYKGYFMVMIVLVMLFQLFDAMASGVYSNLQETIVREFAGLAYNADISVGGSGFKTYQDILSKMTFISLFSYAFMGISPWYKAAADKIGRRPFFLLNAIFLGGALFVGGITNNLYVFLIASTIITFFIIQDIQIMYVMECVPDNKRATWMAVTQAVGAVGNLIVISMRFLPSSQIGGNAGPIPWRIIYIVIGVIGIIVFLISIFGLRESRPFLNSRISYLEKSPEQKAANKEEGKDVQGGVGAGLKLMIQNKQLRWLAIAALLVSTANNVICSYNNTIMAQNGLDSNAITIALFASCIISIFVSFMMGPIADKIGRKWGTVIFGMISAISMLLFVFVSPMITSQLVGGIFAGVCSGVNVYSYLNVMGLNTLMMSESCPASIRGSIIGVRSFCQVTAVLAMVACGFLFRVMPTGTVCALLSVPFLILSSLVVLFKTKETKNLSMAEIEEQFQ